MIGRGWNHPQQCSCCYPDSLHSFVAGGNSTGWQAAFEPNLKNPAALLARFFCRIELVDGNVTLTFTSRPGKIYAIEQGDTLTGWLEIDDGVDSEGDETSFTYPQPAGPAQYIRVREQ